VSVFLVGAGPGDPGLITARGLELIRSCDVLVYDRLVSEELVAEAPADAIRIPREDFAQAELNALLVSLGRRKLEAVRLKGGDPFLFGRGGEEALALADAGVDFEVVPGVSSLASVPGASGIPLTHRGLSSNVTVVSGHDPAALDYAGLAQTPGTLVIFMGLTALETIAERLIAAGKAPETPAAVISRGTTEEEQTIATALLEIAGAASAYHVAVVVLLFDRGISGKIAGQEIRGLRAELPHGMPLIVSGRAVNLLAKAIVEVRTAADFSSIMATMRELGVLPTGPVNIPVLPEESVRA